MIIRAASAAGTRWPEVQSIMQIALLSRQKIKHRGRILDVWMSQVEGCWPTFSIVYLYLLWREGAGLVCKVVGKCRRGGFVTRQLPYED